jgi:hypothetical protein
VDVTVGSTAGRDHLRDTVKATTAAVTDAAMQAAWDVAVGIAAKWVRDGYMTDAPEGVVEFVTKLGAEVLKQRETLAGITSGDGFGAPAFPGISQAFIRQCSGVAGQYVVSPRVVAGGGTSSWLG